MPLRPQSAFIKMTKKQRDEYFDTHFHPADHVIGYTIQVGFRTLKANRIHDLKVKYILEVAKIKRAATMAARHG